MAQMVDLDHKTIEGITFFQIKKYAKPKGIGDFDLCQYIEDLNKGGTQNGKERMRA